LIKKITTIINNDSDSTEILTKEFKFGNPSFSDPMAVEINLNPLKFVSDSYNFSKKDN